MIKSKPRAVVVTRNKDWVYIDWIHDEGDTWTYKKFLYVFNLKFNQGETAKVVFNASI